MKTLTNNQFHVRLRLAAMNGQTVKELALTLISEGYVPERDNAGNDMLVYWENRYISHTNKLRKELKDFGPYWTTEQKEQHRKEIASVTLRSGKTGAGRGRSKMTAEEKAKEAILKMQERMKETAEAVKAEQIRQQSAEGSTVPETQIAG